MRPWLRWALVAPIVLGCGAGPVPVVSVDEPDLAPCEDPDYADCYYDEDGRFCAGARCAAAPDVASPIPEEEAGPAPAAEGEGCRRGAVACTDGVEMTCITEGDGCRLCTCDGSPRAFGRYRVPP